MCVALWAENTVFSQQQEVDIGWKERNVKAERDVETLAACVYVRLFRSVSYFPQVSVP